VAGNSNTALTDTPNTSKSESQQCCFPPLKKQYDHGRTGHIGGADPEATSLVVKLHQKLSLWSIHVYGCIYIQSYKSNRRAQTDKKFGSTLVRSAVEPSSNYSSQEKT